MIHNYKFGIDLDGTLTDSLPFDYNKYYNRLDELIESAKFIPVKNGVEVISEMELDITIITGRGNSFRKVTNDWLIRNGICFRELVMIEDYENNKFNNEVYLDFKLKAYLSRKINFCLDDDEEVVNMLNNYGIKAVKVDGDFREAFNKLFI